MSEWISVEEGLPDPYDDVLVWPRPSEYTLTGQYWRDPEKWVCTEYEQNFGEVHSDIRVTHWMPLPEPPSNKT